MLSLFYSWYNYDKELQVVLKQRRLRHELHRQIIFSKLKLNPTITIYKTGIHDLDKQNNIIIPAAVPVPKTTKKKKH